MAKDRECVECGKPLGCIPEWIEKCLNCRLKEMQEHHDHIRHLQQKRKEVGPSVSLDIPWMDEDKED